MDKVEEYINFTFEKKIDREIIRFLWSPSDYMELAWFLWRPSGDRWRTRNEIYAAIPPSSWNTFNRRLEKLCKDENPALVWRTPKPEDWTATHRPPRSFHIHPNLSRKINKRRGPVHIVKFARQLREEGTPAPGDSELLDLVLEWDEETTPEE